MGVSLSKPSHQENPIQQGFSEIITDFDLEQDAIIVNMNLNFLIFFEH